MFARACIYARVRPYFSPSGQLIHLGLTEATASLGMPSTTFQEYVLTKC